jgi:hypothetical protein
MTGSSTAAFAHAIRSGNPALESDRLHTGCKRLTRFVDGRQQRRTKLSGDPIPRNRQRPGRRPFRDGRTRSVWFDTLACYCLAHKPLICIKFQFGILHASVWA